MASVYKLLLVGLLVVLTLVSGCSGGGGGEKSTVTDQQQQTKVELLAIQVTPDSPVLSKDTKLQLVATGIYSDNTNKDLTSAVSWQTAEGNIATIGNASETPGLITPQSVGSTKITASLGTVSGGTNVSVSDASLLSIALAPVELKVAGGMEKQLQATGVYSDSSTRDLTSQVSWTSSNAGIASVTQSGLLKTVSSGSVTITAVLSGITTSTVVTVTPASLVSIDVTAVAPAIASGTTQQLVATGVYSDGTSDDLTASAGWSSSNAAVGSVTDHGMVVGAQPGVTTVSAASGGVVGSLDITVTAAKLESLDVTLDYDQTAQGVTQSGNATGYFPDGSVQDLSAQVTWLSSRTDVATVSNAIGSKATVTSVGTGETSITASLGHVTGTAQLTVTSAQLTAITITPVAAQIALGTNVQFLALGTASDGSTCELTPYVSWSSSDGTVANLSSTGLNTGLMTSVGVGSTFVTATYHGLVASTALKVVAGTLTAFSITPADTIGHLGAPVQMTATGTFTDVNGNSWSQDLTSQVTWGTSNKLVVSIGNSAQTHGLAIPLQVGTVNISAVFQTASASTSMSVSAAELTGIIVTPENPVVAIHGSVQMLATGVYADGFASTILSSALKWSTTDKQIAAVANCPVKKKGLLRGMSTGAAGITAVLRGVKGGTVVTVNR